VQNHYTYILISVAVIREVTFKFLNGIFLLEYWSVESPVLGAKLNNEFFFSDSLE
jgi:hypothetical protein